MQPTVSQPGAEARFRGHLRSRKGANSMCGIAGVIERGVRSAALLEGIARRMAAPLVHRGPDADGAWTDAAAGVGIGHRRLSIIDLSPAGAQPMVSASGRLAISYNGEIYNAAERFSGTFEEAADEFFGGYSRHVSADRLLNHPVLEHGSFAKDLIPPARPRLAALPERRYPASSGNDRRFRSARQTPG